MGNGSAECLAYTLMSQAHAQNGHFSLKLYHCFLQYAGIPGISRSGRQYQVAWFHTFYVIHGYLVVADHLYIRLNTPNHLYQVIGKAVIIIN